MVFERHTYAAYGDRDVAGVHARVAYIGEVRETGTGHYLLGERLYDPTLRRFHNTDPQSPFDEGGINRYAYCSGDPINRMDKSGNAWRGWPFNINSGLKAAAGTADRITALPATPSATVIASASALDIRIAVGNVASGVLPATVDQPSDAIFGTLSAAAIGRRSAGPGLWREPNGSAAGELRTGSTEGPRYLGKNQSRHRAPTAPSITVISDPQGREVFQHPNGRRYIEPKWHERHMNLANGETASHWLADAPVVTTHVLEPLQRISATTPRGARTNVYVYTGVHGAENGQNWINGSRAHSAPLQAGDIQTFDIFRASASNLTIYSEDIFGISSRSMEERMRRPGPHIHAYCFSAVDVEVTRNLNIGPIPVYNIP
ncbi:MAG: RHS repeat-associated core domain-containing protein [Luteibacter jiangsuensis]